jgi:hypothetical protein
MPREGRIFSYKEEGGFVVARHQRVIQHPEEAMRVLSAVTQGLLLKTLAR